MTAGRTTLMAAACGFVLAFPPQVHEIYRAMAEAMSLGVSGSWVEPVASFIALVLLCWAIFLLNLTYDRSAQVAVSRVRWIMLVVVSHLPLVGAAIGIYRSRISSRALEPLQSALARARLDYLVQDGAGTPEELAPIAKRFAANIMQFDDYLFYSSFVSLGLAVTSASLLLVIFARRVSLRSGQRRDPAVVAIAAAIVTAALICLFASSYTRVAVPRAIMPVPLLAIALFLIGFWFWFLSAVGRRWGFPFLTAVLSAAIVFSALDLNDNHKIRNLPDTRSMPPRSGAGDQFLAWLESRPDFASFAGRKYPIYLIAAQGGGIYAAYHAASFLASVQDDCPRFGQHVFAISGVSGGSVGASVFASLLYQAHAAAPSLLGDRPCRTAKDTSPVFQDATDELLSKDYLTPLLGGFMFTDFFQQILPFPVGAFDRARSLEIGLEQSWKSVMASKQFKNFRGDSDTLGLPLSMPLAGLWQTTRTAVPALVLNTTEVDSGRRRLLAPFVFDGIDLSFVPVWNNTELARRAPEDVPNIAVSSAAFLSSRFPWVTPAGYFMDVAEGAERPSKVRVVDGGYFENSGVATVLDLLASVEAALDSDGGLQPFRDRIEINIITLNSKRFDLSGFLGFGEWLAPISTMMSTRSARAPIETSRAELLVERSTRTKSGVAMKLFRFDLDGLGYPLPLGWRLSPVTRLLITNELGTRSRCRSSPAAGSEISPDCLKKAIAEQLGVE